MSKKLSRTNLVCLLLVAAAFVATGVVYGRLPPRIPIHWSFDGQIDGYAPKPWGPLAIPLGMAGLYLLFAALRVVSPRTYNLEGFLGAFEIVEAAALGFCLLLTIVVLRAGLGERISMTRVVAVGLGLLFVVLGNFMGKFTPNFFVGIRTPWTLANPEVWLRTHRLGGWLWVLGGFVLVLAGLVGHAAEPLTLVVVAFMSGVPLVYSYVIYRRLERGGAGLVR